MAASRRNPMTDLALIAVFAALIAAFALVPGIQVGVGSVPITLQTLGIGLTAMVLGPWRGFLATSLYLVVGFLGLPVFASGASGIGVLSHPSGGYLISFPLYALLVGALSQLVARRRGWVSIVGLVVAGLLGSALLVHPLGILGMMHALHKSFAATWNIDVIFWPGDVLKTVVAAVIAHVVHSAFPSLAWGGRRTHKSAVTA